MFGMRKLHHSHIILFSFHDESEETISLPSEQMIRHDDYLLRARA